MFDFQQEKLDIEEKYSSLQEEVNGKTKKLKRVWQMLGQAKSEASCLKMFDKYAHQIHKCLNDNSRKVLGQSKSEASWKLYLSHS